MASPNAGYAAEPKQTTVGLATTLSEWQVRRPERHDGDAPKQLRRVLLGTAVREQVARCALVLLD